MKIYMLKIYMLLVSIALLLTACFKDKPGETNEEELITTMNVKFTPVTGGAAIVYSFDDADGPGGIAPVQQEIVLAANVAYNAEIELLNKSVSPAGNITTEVAAEAEAHRFFYQPSLTSNIVVNNFNNDANGMPLGITSTWAAGVTGTGTITITLRHYPGTPPDKQTADGVTSPKSTTDIAISFTTRII